MTRADVWRVAVRPRMLGMLALFLAAAVVCGLLGAWQLDRARERGEAAQTARQASLAAADPVPLESVLAPQTTFDGETLRFGPVLAGVARLISAQARPKPRVATMTLRPDSLGTEALFAFADGSFWRRHFNVRFTPTGADVILWVFDANGTRARTWRGSAVRQTPYAGRAPT